jgi:hypothetical protein
MYSSVGTGPSYEGYPQPGQQPTASKYAMATVSPRRPRPVPVWNAMPCVAGSDGRMGEARGSGRKRNIRTRQTASNPSPQQTNHLLPRNDPADPPRKLQQCSAMLVPKPDRCSRLSPCRRHAAMNKHPPPYIYVPESRKSNERKSSFFPTWAYHLHRQRLPGFRRMNGSAGARFGITIVPYNAVG